MVQTTVRKGDVVALAVTRSITYAFGSGRGTERVTRFTLAIVNTASNAGEAKSLMRRTGLIMSRHRKDFTLQDVHTISRHTYQAQALVLFSKLTWQNDEFDTPEALRAAIEATPTK